MTSALELSERAFMDDQVVPFARLRRWLVYHPHSSLASEAGFPDLTLIREPRLVFAELKSNRGRATAEQVRWLEELDRCDGCEVYLWRPRDWAEVERVLM